MTYAPRPTPALFPEPILRPATLDIVTISYEERRIVFPAITHALDVCGCWLLDRKPLSFTQIEFSFELPMYAVVDLYAALIAAGLELTRASHDELTLLCLLRKYRPTSLSGIVTCRLEVGFVEEGSPEPALSSGTTHS